MTRNTLQKLAAAAAALCLMSACTGCGNTGSTPSADVPEQSSEPPAEPQVFTENITGTQDGYDYELWKDKGTTSFTVDPAGGTFSCEWSDINNALFRRG